MENFGQKFKDSMKVLSTEYYTASKRCHLKDGIGDGCFLKMLVYFYSFLNLSLIINLWNSIFFSKHKPGLSLYDLYVSLFFALILGI